MDFDVCLNCKKTKKCYFFCSHFWIKQKTVIYYFLEGYGLILLIWFGRERFSDLYVMIHEVVFFPLS